MKKIPYFTFEEILKVQIGPRKHHNVDENCGNYDEPILISFDK